MTNDHGTLVKTRELRTKLPEFLARVKAGERLVVERHSEAVAALVPLEDYWRLRHDRVRARSGKDTMHTYRIVVTNVSGGEGKTTTAREVAYALASRGYRVGLLDLDPQASLTKSLGLHDPREDGLSPAALAEDATALGVFARDGAALPAPIGVFGVDVWPANAALGGADALLSGDPSKLHNLRDALDALEGYDFLLLDTKPSLSHLLYASVAAADHLVVPVNGIKGMENLEELGKLLKLARPVSPHIGVRLFVPNRIRPNLNHHKNVMATLQQYAAVAPVSRAVGDRVPAVGSALESRQPIVVHRPRSEAAQEYQAVADDLLAALGVAASPSASAVEETA